MLTEFLWPTTDAGVLAQVVVLVVVVGVAVWRTWRVPEVRLFVLAVGVFVLGLMALRASH